MYEKLRKSGFSLFFFLQLNVHASHKNTMKITLHGKHDKDLDQFMLEMSPSAVP